MGQRYLGIDYGSKRVGIAVSDEEAKLAFPRAVLANSRNLVGKVQRICEEEGVSEIVLGESNALSGEPNPIMEDIIRFKEALAQETGLPIHLEPEYFTSQQAERFQGKIPKLDASAAALILQSYLDKYR